MAKQNKNFTVGKVSRLHVQFEISCQKVAVANLSTTNKNEKEHTQRFGHIGIFIVGVFFDLLDIIGIIGHLKHKGHISEAKIFGWNKTIQEDVDS